jgi:hypothetical protein
MLEELEQSGGGDRRSEDFKSSHKGKFESPYKEHERGNQQ